MASEVKKTAQKPQNKLDKESKKALLEARSLIEDIFKTDSNEAETRRRIERIFEKVLGYDVLKHISREYAIHGVGDTEHSDFAISVNDDENPCIIIEIKRVGTELTKTHLKQAASYAVNLGCEWTLLTNGRAWELYHITFSQPPQTKLIEKWNLISDDLPVLAEKFGIIGYKNVKRQGLKQLWNKRNVLTPRNLLKIALSEESIRMFQRGIRKIDGITVSPEDIVVEFRHLLNETALLEMDKVKISLPAKSTPKANKAKSTPKITNENAIDAEQGAI
jgi:hypothetical protein